MAKMNWDSDGYRLKLRDGGGERADSTSSMRNDPVQAAGAEIDLPDKFSKLHKCECPNKICQMRTELLKLVQENNALYQKRLRALGQDV